MPPDYALAHFRDFTPQEIATICNGCGGKGAVLDPPDWIFHASCDWHDFEYLRGGQEEDRLDSDLGFYAALLEDARMYAERGSNQITRYFRLAWARTVAWGYFRAVRLFGAPHWRTRPFPLTYREMKDLILSYALAQERGSFKPIA